MKKLVMLLIAGLLVSQMAFGQQGTLGGTIVDSESGETLIGVNISIPEINSGTATDLDGRYNFQLAPGAYTLEISYISYQTKVIEGVEVKEGEVTTIDAALSQGTLELEQVVVTASAVDNSEVSVLRLQKNSLSIQDGISAEEIRKIGFSNSAESMKRITGATVEGGKYIVMRGLGDRYSISTMDGITLPSTNPYRNSANLDLIPTNMVDNIVVKKTFTPDLPGNFTGGAVDISTRSIPDRFYASAKLTLGFNDQTTFNDNFLTDPVENKYAWLGYDDGSRKIPDIAVDNPILSNPGPVIREIRNDQSDSELINGFNKTMRAFSDRSYSFAGEKPGLSSGFNFNTGNRLVLKNTNVFGYNLGLNYSRDFTLYDNRVINYYRARIANDDSRMFPHMFNSGSESSSSATVGGILSMAYQFGSANELGINVSYSNTGEESILNMDEGSYPGAISGGGGYRNRVLGFQQRNLLNTQLKGEHSTKFFGNTKIEWSGNYIQSNQYDPDLRFMGTPMTTSGDYGNFIAEVSEPFHFFRDLEDVQYSGKLDLNSSFGKTDIKYGVFYTRKERDFTERRYQISTRSNSDEEYISFTDANGDFSAFFGEDNMGMLGTDADGNAIIGNYYSDQTQASNLYEGYEQVTAAYLMGTFQLSNKLKAVAGARVEKTEYRVATKANPNNAGLIDAWDVLPSLNFIYALNDKANLRLSGSRTVARPNMREMAPFISFDLQGGFPVIGNPDIKRTNITNVDIRYEIFPKSDELFAISLFYKNFENPIVVELDVATDQPQYQYVNSRTGQLGGIELELRKGLEFISSSLDKFSFGTNFTYIHSRVKLRPEEYEVRRNINPDLKDWRPFAGQSPYIINLLFSYDNPDKGWQSTLYANAFGPRIYANGSGAAPDTYEIYGWVKDKENNRVTGNIPVPDLNFRLRKQFNNSISVALTLSNLLDYNIVRYQEHNDVYYTNDLMNPGRTFKLSLGYSFR